MWVADVTYCRDLRRLGLCRVHRRRLLPAVVSWQLSKSLRTDLALTPSRGARPCVPLRSYFTHGAGMVAETSKSVPSITIPSGPLMGPQNAARHTLTCENAKLCAWRCRVLTVDEARCDSLRIRRFGVRIPTGARRARRQRQRPPERFSPGVFRVECRASAPSRERSERPRRTDREAAGQDADLRFCRFSGLLSRCLHSVIPAAQLPWGLCGDRPPSNRGRTLRLSSRYTFGENCRYACSCTHRANRPALDVLGAQFTG